MKFASEIGTLWEALNGNGFVDNQFGIVWIMVRFPNQSSLFALRRMSQMIGLLYGFSYVHFHDKKTV